MNRKNVSKIGFFTSFSMLVGSVIGIGIFLKNNSVFRQTTYNATNTILAWVVAGVICLVTAIAYGEISLSSFSKLGLAKWSENYGGSKLGNFIKRSLPLFYFGLLLPGISYYAAEILLLNFGINNSEIMADGLGKFSSIGLTLGLGTIIFLLFMGFNFLSLRFSGYFQKFSLIIKFIPLIVVLILGIAFGIIAPTLNLFNKNPGDTVVVGSNEVTIQPVSFNLIILALPGILFAFDSFLNVGTLAPSMQKPKKHLPLVIVIGMIVISTVYILITVGQIFTSQGVSWSVFNPSNLQTIFGITAEKAKFASTAIAQTFFALILVSVLGVVNAFSASSIKLHTGIIEEGYIFGSGFFYKRAKGNAQLAGLYLSLTIGFLWSIVYWGLSFGYNSDVYIDGITNFPTLFLFLIYGLIPLLALIKKIKEKVKKDFKFWKFTFFALISFIGCWFVVFYQAFYIFLWQALKNFSGDNPVRWGGFLETTPTSPILYEAIAVVFLVSLLLFLFLPAINDTFVKLNNWRRANKGLEVYRPKQLVEEKVSFSDFKELSEKEKLTEKKKIESSFFVSEKSKELLKNVSNYDDEDVLVFSVYNPETKKSGKIIK